MNRSVLVPSNRLGRALLAIAVAGAIFADAAGVEGAPNACVKGTVSVKALAKQEDQAFEANDFLTAAQLADTAARTHPVCMPKEAKRRMKMLTRALSAYSRASATTKVDADQCKDPDLLATRMLVRHHAELTALANGDETMAPYVVQLEKWLKERDQISVLAARIHEGLQPPAAQDDLRQAIRDYKAMAQRFPGCASPLREHLVKTTLLLIPPPTEVPSCGANEEWARDQLLQVSTIVRDATDTSSEALRSRLNSYNSLGPQVEAAQVSAAKAETAGSLPVAAESYAGVLVALPECAVYHTARADALVGSLRVLEQMGDRVSLNRGIALIDKFLETLQGANVSQTPEYLDFGQRRSKLVARIGEIRSDEDRRRSRPPAGAAATKARALVSGLAINMALSAGFVVTGTILTARVRRRGPLYMDIVDAYEDAGGLNPYTHADLCTAEMYGAAEAVADACALHTEYRRAAVAMWTLASIAAVSAGVFGGLLAKHRAAHTPRRVSLGVVPGRAGFVVSGGFAF